MAERAELRIATCNLENLDWRDETDPVFAERVALLRPRLERLDADILCVQEVNGQHPPGGGPRRLLALEGLCRETRYANHHVASATVPDGDGVADVHNLVVLSRWPISAVRQYLHDLVAPPLYRPATAEPTSVAPQSIRWDRPILHVVVDLPAGAPLHIVNAHLRAPLAAPIAGQKTGALTWKSLGGWAEGFYVAALKRSGQALEVRLLVERIFDNDPGALIAVCGDCNAELREMPLRIMSGALEDIDREDLRARQLLAVEDALRPEQRYTLIHGGERLMLDHILVSRPLAAVLGEVEIDNQDLPDETTLPEADPSLRHAPLRATFAIARLPGRRRCG